MNLNNSDRVYTYCKEKISLDLRFMRDNVRTIAYVNNMDGRKGETCNNIPCKTWKIYIENKLWVAAAHYRVKVI